MSIQVFEIGHLILAVENNLFFPLTLDADMPFAFLEGDLQDLYRSRLCMPLGYPEISPQQIRQGYLFPIRLVSLLESRQPGRCFSQGLGLGSVQTVSMRTRFPHAKDRASHPEQS